MSTSTILACVWPASEPDGIYTLGLGYRPPYALPVYIWYANYPLLYPPHPLTNQPSNFERTNTLHILCTTVSPITHPLIYLLFPTALPTSVLDSGCTVCSGGLYKMCAKCWHMVHSEVVIACTSTTRGNWYCLLRPSLMRNKKKNVKHWKRRTVLVVMVMDTTINHHTPPLLPLPLPAR